MNPSVSLIKRAWRKWRVTQPFNLIATSLLRGLTAMGVPPTVLIEHLPYIGTVSVPLPHGPALKLCSHGDDYMTNHTFWKRGYEVETTTLFYRLARRAAVTVDVGAHVGFYALVAGLANPQSQVYAFEPLPRIYQRLKENIALNRLSNVRPVASAVGETSGTATLYYVDAGAIPSNSTLRKANFAASAEAVQALSVPVTTLGDFAAQNKLPRIDLLKIDTEGTELDVLNGLGGRLEKDRPSIVCEVLAGIGRGEALEQKLKPLGYGFYILGPDGPERREKIVGDPRWWNYLLTPLSQTELETL